MKALDVIACTGFAVAVIALPIFFWNWFAFIIRGLRAEPIAGREIRKPIRSARFFVIPIFVTGAVCETSKHLGHNEVMRALQGFAGNYRVIANGKSVENRDEVLVTLKSVHWIFPHHSSPGPPIGIEISDQSQRLSLWLSRDSGDPHEYWVFYPKYYITKRNEVGHITTSLFDAY